MAQSPRKRSIALIETALSSAERLQSDSHGWGQTRPSVLGIGLRSTITPHARGRPPRA